MSQEMTHAFDNIRGSRVKMQLLLFFFNNPFAVGDLEGVSIWVGIGKEEIAGEIEQLCESGLLVKCGSPSNPCYGLTGKPELFDALRDLLEGAAHARRP